jgi:hypothetical protein
MKGLSSPGRAKAQDSARTPTALKFQPKTVAVVFTQNCLGNRSGAGFARRANRLQKRLIGCPGFRGDMSAWSWSMIQ